MNTMKYTSSISIALIIALAILAGPVMTASAGSVARTVSAITVAPNTNVIVTITPIDLPAGPYQVVETLPAGLTFVESNAFQHIVTGNVHTFRQLSAASFTYKVVSAVEASYTITGTFKDSEQNTGTVSPPTTTVTVRAFLVESYIPPGATPAEKKAGMFKALDDFFAESPKLTKNDIFDILDAFFS